MADGNELGSFLRARREQLRPADAGLPDTGRRRTPGLRREEVATLAGISVDYLIRLEQGRDRNPSFGVIGALASTLRLDGDERKHLAKLAACSSAPGECPMAGGEVDAVPATLQALLDGLHPMPAVLLGPWFQVLAHNEALVSVVRGIGVLDDPAPNMARFTFLDPRARGAYPQWDEIADLHVAILRDMVILWRTEPRIHALVDELLAVPEFAERWRAHDVARRRRGTKVVAHPEVGELRIDYEVLLLPDHTDQRIVTWLPADDATATRLRQLTGSGELTGPARLRVVG